MAFPEIKVDASRAIARFSPAGIPEGVRASLRGVIPDLTKRLGAQVDRNLDAGLRSRTRLTVRKEMVEDPRKIIGRVRTVWTGAAAQNMVPQVLESGSKAHEIAARNAPTLAFFWAKMGMTVFFRRVWHPGFAGIHYMENAFGAMSGEIRTGLTQAVKTGLRK